VVSASITPVDGVRMEPGGWIQSIKIIIGPGAVGRLSHPTNIRAGHPSAVVSGSSARLAHDAERAQPLDGEQRGPGDEHEPHP